MKSISKPHAVIAFVLLLVFRLTSQTDICFNPVVTYPALQNPGALVCADFNNDGIKDLAYRNYNSSASSQAVSVRLGTGAGAFGAISSFNVPNLVYGIVAGDLNNDGNQDLVTQSLSSPSVAVIRSYTGSGSGSFALTASVSVASPITDMALEDYNNDGIKDLVILGNDYVRTYLGTGTGSFTAGTQFNSTWPSKLLSYDFNNDGKLDIAVTSTWLTAISIYTNNGAGSFSLLSDYPIGYTSSLITLGDFNGDLITDLVVSSRYSQPNVTVSMLAGNSGGGFSAPATFTLSDNPSALKSADINHDGKSDLVFTNPNLATVSVFLGSSAGIIQTVRSYSVGYGAEALSLEDINGDTWPDIVTANASANTLGVIINKIIPTVAIANTAPNLCLLNPVTLTATGTATTYTWTGGVANGVAFSPSVSSTYTVTGTSPNGCVIKASTGITVSNCNFLNACMITASTSASSPFPGSIASADFNSDGKADIALVRGVTTNSIAVQNGNGTGGFGAVSYVVTPHQNLELMSRDFTNDGKPDLVVLANNSSVVSVLPGNGSGGFGAAISYTTGAGNNVSFAAGDFNNDGKLDLGISTASNSIIFLTGNGAGGFSSSTTVTVGTTPKSLVFADVNNDGNLDVYCGNNGSSNVSVLIGNGAGSFTPLAPVAIAGTSNIVCKATDFNNDSNTDLVVVGDYNLQLFAGNGNGTFGSPVITPVSWFSYFGMVCRDFNQDGKTDIALNSDSYIQLMMGTGLGSFGSVSTFTFSASGPTSMAESDLNNDGRTDLTLARGNANIVTSFLNMLTPTITISGNANICMGSTASLTASGANTYAWTNGITNGVAFTPTLTGVYSVTATATNGCKNYASQTVTVNPIPTVSVTAHQPVISPGQTAILEASGSATYTWNTGATTSTIAVSPQTTTTYTVIASTGSLCPGGVNSATVTQVVSAFSGQGGGQINYQWAKHIPNSSGQNFYGIKTAADTSGNFILTSQYTGNIDLDPSAAVVNLNGSSNDRFIAKYSNTGALLWYLNFGSTSLLALQDLQTDAAGNIFMMGDYQGTFDFDPTAATFNMTSAGSHDVFIIKLSPAGNFLWAKSVGGADWDVAYSITTDNGGNLYCTGGFSVSIDCDPGPAVYNVTGYNDIFMMKLSPAGNFIWAKAFGGSGADISSRIKLDTYGNIFIQGTYWQMADMDPSSAVNTLSTAGNGQIFLAKYDNNGNYLWAANGYMGTLEIDNLNNLYFYGGINNGTGSNMMDMDYSPTVTAYINLNAGFYISKYDEYGNYLWAKAFNRRIGTNSGFGLNALKIDNNGEIYIAGGMNDTQDFDPSSTVANIQSYGTDAFIAKYNNQCDYLVATHIGNTNGISATSLYLDKQKNIFISGGFGYTADFDPSSAVANITTTNIYNLYMAKYGTCSSQLNIAVSSATVCAGSSASLTATGVSTYSWSTGATTSSITVMPTTSSGYTVNGTDAANCSYTQTIALNVSQSCQDVWPGDANSDGVADNFDVLELGLHFSQSGPVRATTSNSWQSYYANNWAGTISNGKNVNHSDCNGDGTINSNDTLAIFSNYGLTHAFKPTEPTAVNPQLSIVPDQNLVAKGNWGTASVFLGESSAPVSNVNGLGFTVTFDQSVLDANSFYIEYPSSFINAANQNLDFSKPDFSNGKLYTATTHTLTNQVSGNGKIAVLHYKISSALSADGILNLGIVQAKKSDAAGALTALTVGTATVALVVSPVGLDELNVENSMALYPNPAMNSATIQSNSLLQKVEVLSLTGQIILSETASGAQHQLDLRNVTNGVYLVTIYSTDQKVVRKKLVVQR